MIGLIALAAIAVWLMVTIHLCKRIPDWLGMTRFAKAAQYLLFPVLLLLPIADELIGAWQFKRLCEREAAVTLSPNWQIVKRAQKASAGPVYLNGYIIQIREWTTKFIDADTGKELFLSKAFITNGGILFGRFGLGLGTSRSCSPPDEFQIMHMINIDQLLKQGEIK